MNDSPVAEDLLFFTFLLYEIDFVHGSIIGELARRNLQKYENTVRLLRFNNRICYVSNIKAVSKSFRCCKCDTFLIGTFNLERQLTKSSEQIKNNYPRNVHQFPETHRKTSTPQKIAIFDFESFCVQEQTSKVERQQRG